MPGADSFIRRSVSCQQKWCSGWPCTLIIRLERPSSADMLGIRKISQLAPIDPSLAEVDESEAKVLGKIAIGNGRL